MTINIKNNTKCRTGTTCKKYSLSKCQMLNEIKIMSIYQSIEGIMSLAGDNVWKKNVDYVDSGVERPDS